MRGAEVTASENFDGNGEKLRVMVVDDHALFRRGLEMVLAQEPDIDLGVAAAIASNYREKPIPPDTALIGEVGLSGELRAVNRLSLRVREAAKLGFKRCIVPKAGGGAAIMSELERSGLPEDFHVFASTSLAVALEVALH